MSSEHHYCDYDFGGEDFPSSSPIQPLANSKITHHEIEGVTELPNKPIVTPEEELVIKKFFENNPNLRGKTNQPVFNNQLQNGKILGAEDLPNPPILSPEEELVIKKFFDTNPNLKTTPPIGPMDGPKELFRADEPWIQTYSGRRFTPTNPMFGSIVIQDIAHALSMQCRFSGHVKKFYSVAQHSISVSYLCNAEDALWGLMHDASEAYLVDVPTPIKKSGHMAAYIQFEKQVQEAVCKRFNLPLQEPPSVKKADMLMLVTEARDLINPRSDWKIDLEPLPFTIDPWSPEKAKHAFMKRFFQLTNNMKEYEDYLQGKGSD